jgi:hypothetical protein
MSVIQQRENECVPADFGKIVDCGVRTPFETWQKKYAYQNEPGDIGYIEHPSTSTQFWRTECSYPLGQLGSTALLCSTLASVSGGAVSRHATPASQHDRGCSSRGSSHLRRPMVNDSLLGSGTLHRLLRAQGGAGQVLTWTNALTVPTLVDLQVNPSAEDVGGCATIGRGQTWRPGDSANLVHFYFCGIMKCPMFGIAMDAHGCPIFTHAQMKTKNSSIVDTRHISCRNVWFRNVQNANLTSHSFLYLHVLAP